MSDHSLMTRKRERESNFFPISLDIQRRFNFPVHFYFRTIILLRLNYLLNFKTTLIIVKIISSFHLCHSVRKSTLWKIVLSTLCCGAHMKNVWKEEKTKCRHLCVLVIFGVEKVSATERNTMRDSILEQNWKGDSLLLDGNAAVALKNGTDFIPTTTMLIAFSFALCCLWFLCQLTVSILLVLEAMRKWTIGRMRETEWERERERIGWWTTGEISYFLTGSQSQKYIFCYKRFIFYFIINIVKMKQKWAKKK
jgi:hypothetical protein